MSAPTNQAQLAAYRRFMALLISKATPLVLGEQTSAPRRPRATEGRDRGTPCSR